MSIALLLAEPSYREAAARAASFELRVRLIGGTLPTACEMPINSNLGEVLDALVAHFDGALSAQQREALQRARTLRNKVLHCEFSSVRAKLNESSPTSRGGGVTKLDLSAVEDDALKSKIGDFARGVDVGQVAVATTKTKKLKDVYGWLLEATNSGEFLEASAAFDEAIGVLTSLPR